MNILSSETKRNIISYFITFTIYIPFFAWWIFSQPILRASSPQPQLKETTLNIAQFKQETPPTFNNPYQKREEVSPPQEQQPLEPAVSKEIATIVPPKKKIVIKQKPKIVKQSAPKVFKKPKNSIEKKQTKSHKEIKKSTTKSNKRGANRSNSKQSGSEKKNNRFINQLKAKINANKTYPHIAEKRGMQGSVTISFTINSAGSLTSLQASGSRIFINSAEEAVKKSFPITTVGVPLPMSVNLILNYRLK